MDLEDTPLRMLRQHKPRKVKPRGKAVKVEQEAPPPPTPPVAHSPFAVPLSPYSVPPASPCRTPIPSFPPASPVQPRPSPQRVSAPLTPNNDVFYYDLNLNCTTRGKPRRLTESEPAVVEMLAPHSALGDYSDTEEGTRQMLQGISVKQEILAAPKKAMAMIANEEEGDDGQEDEEEDETLNGLDLSNLVVMEAVNEMGEKAFHVHLVDQATDEMSEEPLDLPQEVIDYIVEAHQKQQTVD